MKNFWGVVLGLFLIGCGGENAEYKTEKTEFPRPPAHVILRNANEEMAGIAALFSAEREIFAAPSFLFENDAQPLFWQGKKIEIFGRMLEKNMVFLRLDFGLLAEDIKFSAAPPAVGSEVFWLQGSEIRNAKVQSISKNEPTFVIDAPENISVSEFSGSPIFGANGEIFGIISGASAQNRNFLGLRSDAILAFLDENF